VSFNFFSLDYVYYPVSGILWVWHKVFGSFMGADNGWAWVLSVVFLVFTLRAILFKPFMKQMNSQLRMQELQPQMKKIRDKYKDDRQRQSEELMKLNKEAGVNPLAGCLPALIQAPVFLGLFHVLREFKVGKTENYFFGAQDVASFVDAKLFAGANGGGAPLSSFITMPDNELLSLGGDRATVIWVAIPLMILAGIATHMTSRKSIARQSAAAAEAPQTAIMNKVMLYLFPLGVVAGGPFFPLAILIYWLSNNTWTFGQLFVAHRIQDRQKAELASVVEAEQQAASFTKPRPGAKPLDPKRPLINPVSLDKTGPTAGTETPHGSSTNGSTTNGSTNGSSPLGNRPAPGARPAGARPGGPGKKKSRKR
jgi:YidC/Oxa1 family membrane protein insertase